MAKIVILFTFMIFSSCTTQMKNCTDDAKSVNLLSKVDSFKTIDSLLRLSNIIYISPKSRGLDCIEIGLQKDSLSDLLRCTNFISSDSSLLRIELAMNNTNSLSSIFGSFNDNSAKVKIHNILSILQKSNILSYNKSHWGVSFVTTFGDSSYHELKKKGYKDTYYAYIEKKYKNCRCPINYRYEILLFDNLKNTQESINIFRKERTLYNIKDNSFYSRTLFLSNYCQLSDTPYFYCDD